MRDKTRGKDLLTDENRANGYRKVMDKHKTDIPIRLKRFKKKTGLKKACRKINYEKEPNKTIKQVN